jgi:hypothetical protein
MPDSGLGVRGWGDRKQTAADKTPLGRNRLDTIGRQRQEHGARQMSFCTTAFSLLLAADRLPLTA